MTLQHNDLVPPDGRVRLDAGASSALRSVLAAPAQRATLLGATLGALYLRRSIASAPGVVALVAHDAVRLPCALVLPTTAAELPLTAIGASCSDAVIGDNCLAWTGLAGPVVVHSVREWAVAQVRRSRVAADAFVAFSDALPAPDDFGIDGSLVGLLTTEPKAAIDGLLGLGPGLTPAGDDVLAGFLLGARAFGLAATTARARAVADLAPSRTTALSAALLWHASRGECLPEVAAFVADPGETSLRELLRTGHTSGAALATGLVTAAQVALCAGGRAA